MNALDQLQQWYQDQCNGEWEHEFGISIETLDNPGWTVRIDLNQTGLENRDFETVENLQPDDDWIKCWVEDGKFNGVGGPRKLTDILETFLRWAS
jgi:hypothetical protein